MENGIFSGLICELKGIACRGESSQFFTVTGLTELNDFR